MKDKFYPQYCDNKSVLLVNQTGNLKKLYCPFRVKKIGNKTTFKSGIILWVDEVESNSQDELIYWILGKPYSHTDFEIKATF